MKSAIIFATYIPDVEASLIVSDYLSTIEDNFSGWDTDIYTGVNYCHSDKILDVFFKQHSFKSDYDKVDDDLVVDSDASAYQKALELYKNSKKDYDYVWFIHTKSVTSKCHDFRNEVMRDFISRRDDIEKFMEENKLDMFYPWVSQCSVPKELNDNLNKILKKCPNDVYLSKFWALTSQYTFYVFSGRVMNNVLEYLKDDFFNKNLIEDYGMNKYFFENDFCMIPFKLGFERFGYDKGGHKIKFLENYMSEKTYCEI